MAPKPTLGRTVAIGVVLGLAGCAVLLGSNDGAMQRSLSATQERAARSLQYDMNDDQYADPDEFLAGNIISEQDAGAEVWLINQPKCGTGTLLTSLVDSMDCKEDKIYATMGEYVGSAQLSALNINPKDHQFHTYKCANQNQLVFTHTPKNAMALRMEYQARKVKQNQDAGKCVVVSAIRDPHDSIPSLWFWMNRERLCEGRQRKEKVLDKYKRWLQTPKDDLKEQYGKETPHESLVTTAGVLRMFGVPRTNEALLEVLRQLAADGHTVIDAPNDGVWAGCSLLLLQVDWEKGSMEHVERHLGAYAVDGTNVIMGNDNKSNCPKSEELYRHIKEYELGDGIIDHLSADNPMLKAGMTYYKEFHNFRKLAAALEGQSPQSLARQMFGHNQ